MLVHRLRRWPNIEPALGRSIVLVTHLVRVVGELGIIVIRVQHVDVKIQWSVFRSESPVRGDDLHLVHVLFLPIQVWHEDQAHVCTPGFVCHVQAKFPTGILKKSRENTWH